MAKSPQVVRGTDQPPNAAEVGNHHWPDVSNWVAGHEFGGKRGAAVTHHSHTKLSKLEKILIHSIDGWQDHDEFANYHSPDTCKER